MAKVILLKTDGLRESYLAAKRCYSNSTSEGLVQDIGNDPREKMEIFLAEKILAKGHMQALEPIIFWFAIDDIPRSCAHQMVRTRMASICEKSLRRTDIPHENAFAIPTTIKSRVFLSERVEELFAKCNEVYEELVANGIPKEDARCVLPLATKTSMHATYNFSSLWNLIKTRTCSSTQNEYREVAQEMKRLAQEAYPILMENAGPPCVRSEKCIGGHSCKSIGNPTL